MYCSMHIKYSYMIVLLTPAWGSFTTSRLKFSVCCTWLSCFVREWCEFKRSEKCSNRPLLET